MKTRFRTSLSLSGIILAVVFTYTFAMPDQFANNIQKEATMKTIEKQHKETIRFLYEDILNNRKFELLEKIIAADYTGFQGVKGAEGFRQPVMNLMQTLPDVQWELKKLIAEDNHVVVQWITKATHTGPFLNIVPTGNKVVNDGMAVYEFKEGKIINAQVLTDRLGFLQTLGAVPTDLSLLTNQKAESEHIRLIDKFTVPADARQEFLERVKINRNFIRTLPGFVEDTAYERTDENGNLIFVTIAVWKNEKALKNAKEAVQGEYKKQDFNPAEMFERLNIFMDRGTYMEVKR